MGVHLARAQLLLEQGRPELAEPELRQAILEEAEPALAHALLALCLTEAEKFEEATREAQQSIAKDPDLSFAHYVLGTVLLRRDRPDEAVAPAQEALRLDPEQASYHALLASIALDQRRWTAALEAAEAGLALDAEHVACNNLRATALVKLGRRDEAGATIAATLAREPENAWSHANQGWTLLHGAEPRKAMEHFREALRLEPGNEWARAGIVEALKAHNFIYGLMLRYFLWMSRLSGRAQWVVVMAGYFGNQFLRRTAAANPKLAPYITPITYAYLVFAVMTWIAAPLFNLFLRLHPFGKHALSDEQKRASNWIGACLGLAVASFIGWLIFRDPLASLLALYFGLLLLPLSGVFSCQPGWPRLVMAVVTAALAALPILAVAVPGDGMPFFTAFGIGIFFSGFLANGLSQVQPRH